jgi:hypothetical protein
VSDLPDHLYNQVSIKFIRCIKVIQGITLHQLLLIEGETRSSPAVLRVIGLKSFINVLSLIPFGTSGVYSSKL